MRIRASSLGSTSANRSKKGPITVEKLATVPPISTSGLCTELCARWGGKWPTFLNWWNDVDAAERKTLKSRRFSSPDFRSSRIGRVCNSCPPHWSGNGRHASSGSQIVNAEEGKAAIPAPRILERLKRRCHFSKPVHRIVSFVWSRRRMPSGY